MNAHLLMTDEEGWGQYSAGGAIVRAKQYDGPFTVQKSRGTEYGNRGDWAVIPINGEPHVCPVNIFRQVYRPLSGGGDIHERTS